MKFKILTLGAGLALAAGAAAFAADAPPAGGDPRNEARIIIICEAGPGGPGGPAGLMRHPGPGGPEGHGDMHGKLDANDDGSISRDEFRAAHDEMFGKMDKNHDGKLSGDEVPHGHGPGGPGGERIEMRFEGPGGHHGPGGPPGANCRSGAPGEMSWTEHGGPGGPGSDVRIVRHGPAGPDGHDEMDKNKDGKISFDEFAGPMREHFNDADKNHNGYLEEDEMKGDHQFIFRRVETN